VGSRIGFTPGSALVACLLCGGLIAAGCGASSNSHVEASGRSESVRPAPQLHVLNNELVNAVGQRVVVHGVNRSGGQFACVQGLGIWSGPMNEASVTAMKNWGVNAVRVPLNEACWNGESYVNATYSGTYYQQAVEAYVRLLNRNGMVAILDLHWTDGAYTGPSSACSSAQAVCQKPMPDAAQSIPFWKSVAQEFKNNGAVIFDLFNEPYPDKAAGNVTDGWNCWLHGGTCHGISYQVAGMQSLVNTVRSTGAENVIMLGGLTWANNLTQWLAYEPSDPDHSLAASWHSYSFNSCNAVSCWNSEVAPVIAKVPVIVGELGEKDCADTYVDPLTAWLDSKSTSYLAWSWNVGKSCESGPSLISSYDGTPTSYGAGYRSDLLSLSP
jgi:endoglucanase